MSFGPQFATDEEYVRAGFDRFMDEISGIGNSSRATMFECALRTHVDGTDRPWRKNFIAALDGVNWSWPWFDYWVGRFQASDDWPRLCRKLRDAVSAGDADEIEDQRRELLWHTLIMAGYSARNQAKRLPRAVPHASMTDKTAGIAHAEPFIVAFNSGDTSTWPPYFPGDITDARWTIKRG